MDLQKTNYERVKKRALECERLQYDSLWFNDHFFPPSAVNRQGRKKPQLECWTTLTALASVTQKVRLGPLVLCNSFRHPALLAKMAATLDVISKGRLELGLGAGWYEPEYNAYGISYAPLKLRVAQLKESVQVIRKMWTEDETNFRGRFYLLKKAYCYPKPVQKPHPRIWIGGYGEEFLLRVVAEVADVYNNPLYFRRHWIEGFDYVKRKIDVLKRHCLSVDRNPDEIVDSLAESVLIANSEHEAQQKIKRYVEASNRRPSIAGTPEECINAIRKYLNIGVSYFILVFEERSWLDEAKIFAEEVMYTLKNSD